MPRHKKKKRAEAAGASAKRTDWLVGDLVVAKLRGHRPWPAQIQKPEDFGYTPRAHRIFVTFYGTEETCFCSYNKITPFTPAVRKGLAEQLQKINTNPELERAIKEIFAADDEHKLSLKSHASHSKEDELAAEKSEEETPAPPAEVTRKRGRGVEDVVAPEVNAVEYSRPAKHEKSISTMAVEQVEKLPRKVRIKVSAQTSDSANQQAGGLVGSDKASVSSLQSDVSLRPSEASTARGKVASKNVDSPTTSKVDDSSVNCSYSCVTLKANGEDAGDEEDGDVFIREVLQNGNEAAAEKMEVDEGVGEEFWKTFDDEGEQRKNAEGQKPASKACEHPDESLTVDIESVSGDDPPRKVKDSGKLVPRIGGVRVVEGLEGTTAVKERVGAVAKEDEVHHVPEDLDRSVGVKEQVSDTVRKGEVSKVPEELDNFSSRSEEVSVAAKEEETESGKVPEDLHSSVAEKEPVSLVVKEDEVSEVPEELHSSSSRKEDASPVANKLEISGVPETLQSSSGDVVQFSEEPKGDEVRQVQEVLDGSSVHDEHVSVVAKTKEDEVRRALEDSSGTSEKDDVSVPGASATAQKEQMPPVAVDVEAPHLQTEVDSFSERQEQNPLVGKEEKVSEPPELTSLPEEQVSAEPMEIEISVVPTSSDTSNAQKDHVSPVVTDVGVSLVQNKVESTGEPVEILPPVREGEITALAEEASVDAMQVTQEATQVPVKITEASEEATDVEVSLVQSTAESSVPQKEHVFPVSTVDDASLVAMDIEGSHVPLESDSSSLQKGQITPVAKEDEVIAGPEGLDNSNARKEQVSPDAKEGDCIRLAEQGGKEVSGPGSDNKNGLSEHQVDVARSTNVDEIGETKKLATSSTALAAGVEYVDQELQAGLPHQEPGKREEAVVTSVVVEERVFTSVVVEELIKEPSQVQDAEPPAPVVEEVLQQEEPSRSVVLDGATRETFQEQEAEDFKHVLEQKQQEAEPLIPLKEKGSELLSGAQEQVDEPLAPEKEVNEAVFPGKEVLGNAVVSETEQVTEALALGKEQVGEPFVPVEYQGEVQHVALQQQDAVPSPSVEKDVADRV